MGTTSENLRRWLEAGLTDHETVEAIEAFESQPSRRASIRRGMEAIADLGAVLVLIALGVIATELWHRLVPWGRSALGLTITQILLVVGLVFAPKHADDPSSIRNRPLEVFRGEEVTTC